MSDPQYVTIEKSPDSPWREGIVDGGIAYKRTNRGYINRHPEVDIAWLEPWCDGCEDAVPANLYADEGRQWCDVDEWGDCIAKGGECARKSVPYRRIA